MTDTQILDLLADRCGGIINLAAALNITRQTVWDWRSRGISEAGRYKVLFLANQHKVRVHKGFLKGRTA